MDGIKLLDRQGRIIWSSHEDQLTWEHSLLDLVAAEDKERVEQHFSRCIIKLETIEFVSCWNLRTGRLLAKTVFYPVENASKSGAMGHGFAAISITGTLPDNFFDFTEQDKEVLVLLAQDKSVWEIAKELDRSESAIDTRIRNLKNKLGCNTLHGLVWSAVRSRLVEPFEELARTRS